MIVYIILYIAGSIINYFVFRKLIKMLNTSVSNTLDYSLSDRNFNFFICIFSWFSVSACIFIFIVFLIVIGLEKIQFNNNKANW